MKTTIVKFVFLVAVGVATEERRMKKEEKLSFCIFVFLSLKCLIPQYGTVGMGLAKYTRLAGLLADPLLKAEPSDRRTRVLPIA